MKIRTPEQRSVVTRIVVNDERAVSARVLEILVRNFDLSSKNLPAARYAGVPSREQVHGRIQAHAHIIDVSRDGRTGTDLRGAVAVVGDILLPGSVNDQPGGV